MGNAESFSTWGGTGRGGIAFGKLVWGKSLEKFATSVRSGQRDCSGWRYLLLAQGFHVAHQGSHTR